jgi:hypothetical protein
MQDPFTPTPRARPSSDLIPARRSGRLGQHRQKARFWGAAVVVLALHLPAPAGAKIAICTEASRGDRRATCVQEGDMGIEKGLAWVLLDIDAPEIANPGCAAEREVGERARDRLVALMAPGYQFVDSGRRDRTERARVHLRLADGRDAGSVLIEEDLARPWQSKGNIWCGW